MRELRPGEGVVIVAKGRRRYGESVVFESQNQIAIDVVVSRFTEALQAAATKDFIGAAPPDLASLWTMRKDGSDQVTDARSRGGAKYVNRRMAVVATRALAVSIEDLINKAIPTSGSGVGT